MSNRTYSYRIENGVVVEGLVGLAQWATENFGGFWVESPVKVWIGGTWTETDGFQPPAEPLTE